MLARPHAPRLAGVEVRASTAPTRRASSPRFASSHAGGLRSRGRRATRRASLTSPRAAGDGESFLDKINPFKKSKSAELAKREADASALINDETRKQLFGDGLMGKMVSGMINQAASGLKEQMSAAAEATEVTYDSAVRACKMDGRVRSALGDDVQATPPMSQMSSSTNVNGVASQQTSVGFLLQSSTGRRAQVQAVSTTTNGVVTVDATVVTETGEQFVIRDCGGGDDVWASDGGGAGGASAPSFCAPAMRASAVLSLVGCAVGQIQPCNDCVEGVVMGGADVVAYFSMDEGDEGIMGKRSHSLEHQGYTFYFSNAENAETFKANPDKYIPAWGGF